MATRPSRSKRLSLEVLETRLLMIVGQRTLPPPTGRGTGFDGVVGLDLAGFATPVFNSTNCTGSLLDTRRHILTAAHCVDNDGDRRADSGLTVTFDVAGAPAGQFILMDVPAGSISIHPTWNGSFDVARGGDLAILELPALAPFPADGYTIYRGGDEIGQIYTMVGYGRTGVGARGQSESNSGPNGSIRRAGKNIYDASAEILRGAPLRESATPPAGTALASDFDNGSTLADAFGRLYRIPNTGILEGDSLEAQGDSGGPSFLGSPGAFQIVGVVSYGIDREFNPSLVTDTNDAFVTFGEINVNTRVSAYTSWIDFVTRRRYDLVLDMRHQIEGLYDSAADEVVLSIKDGVLKLRVQGEVVYQETALARVASIRLLGSQDDETFRVLVDDPALREIITVNGRGGTNRVLYDEQPESHPHTNPEDPLDVNADGHRTALDVLLVINQLNVGGSTLPGAGGAPPYLDVNADDQLTALDALLIINALNAPPIVADAAPSAPMGTLDRFTSTPSVPAPPTKAIVWEVTGAESAEVFGFMNFILLMPSVSASPVYTNQPAEGGCVQASSRYGGSASPPAHAEARPASRPAREGDDAILIEQRPQFPLAWFSFIEEKHGLDWPGLVDRAVQECDEAPSS